MEIYIYLSNIILFIWKWFFINLRGLNDGCWLLMICDTCMQVWNDKSLTLYAIFMLFRMDYFYANLSELQVDGWQYVYMHVSMEWLATWVYSGFQSSWLLCNCEMRNIMMKIGDYDGKRYKLDSHALKERYKVSVEGQGWWRANKVGLEIQGDLLAL